MTLLITSDCGTTSASGMCWRGATGIDVVVTDHHQTRRDDAICGRGIEPAHRRDARYPFRGLCSVSWPGAVVSAYRRKYGAGELPPESFLDLVALATVADVVPLQDETASSSVKDWRSSHAARAGVWPQAGRRYC
ncbi:MAG: hypothetical protein U0231_18030 [Nitrospiraceae bacterium]